MATKDNFLPVTRIEVEVKAALKREADRQDRTLTNFVSIVLKKEAEKIIKQEKDIA